MTLISKSKLRKYFVINAGKHIFRLNNSIFVDFFGADTQAGAAETEEGAATLAHRSRARWMSHWERREGTHSAAAKIGYHQIASLRQPGWATALLNRKPTTWKENVE